ncbi:hypothetical protein DBB36_14455 [Flavobacterium sp. WLB]|uniref:hypothetical protein n=1 Tax=unclassified Flavobacterium TaxID=196869 RepID=UPI0006ABEA45|nr:MULTISPECIES: hypothetical protein [unclassified Flavobacterium]KOP39612.1 hypothetical protein AKO67_03395 [Flavobacterium sp. VMW]OWU90163.1 hypothetical protein APR43_13875 [Flavobacterium sp. NLM]PUU69314.1 hypothetical protein DBB36_14455 [Flavobacterium sp. WLB]
MFNFFKSKKSIHLNGWENELLENIFKALGNDYLRFEKQIAEGIIESVRFDKKSQDYISFKLNISLLNKYEKKNEQLFVVKGVKVFDKISSQYKSFDIFIGYGLVLGYSVQDIFKFDPDINQIKTELVYNFFYENEDFDKIKFLFTEEELKFLNASDIYEVSLNDKIYYHLKDLEDGDFLGIDISGNIFVITHDPFEIILQNEKLEYYFK